MNDYFAYTRVSTAKQGQTGVSLEAQRDAILQYANTHKLVISEWVEEQETAAKRGRSKFGSMMQRLQRREASGVLMHKIDRSARNLKDWADLGDLLDAGVDVRFVTDSLDLNSRGGRLTADIQAVVAADFIRNLREETRKGFYGRLKQGLYPLPAPVGYLDRGGREPKAVDPRNGPLVTQAFELYASGEYPLHRLCSEMKARGLRNRFGKPVAKSSMARILKNTFYIRIIRVQSTGETFEGRHDPIVAPATFRAVQAVLAGKSVLRTQCHEFLFRGLVRCKACGQLLYGERQKGHVYYRCHSRSCNGTSVKEFALDSAVLSELQDVTLTKDECVILEKALEQYLGDKTNHVADERDALNASEAGLRRRLDRLTDLLIDEAIDADDHKMRRAALFEDLAAINQRRAEISQQEAQNSNLSETFFELANTAQLYRECTDIQEKRKLLKRAVSNFLVEGKKPSVELYPAYAELKKRTSVPDGCPLCVDFRTFLDHKTQTTDDQAASGP